MKGTWGLSGLQQQRIQKGGGPRDDYSELEEEEYNLTEEGGGEN